MLDSLLLSDVNDYKDACIKHFNNIKIPNNTVNACSNIDLFNDAHNNRV